MKIIRLHKIRMDLVEAKAQKRTQELEAARLNQLSELYRFAELGRLSTALFHDLANHLTNISLDIEKLGNSYKSDILHRIHCNVRHIDGVVRRVRRQIQGNDRHETFNILDEIKEVVNILSFDAGRAGVTISLEPGNVRPSLLYTGDLTRFRRILLNVTSNAIEAYEARPRRKQKPVIIRLERTKRVLTLSVTDHAQIIPSGNLRTIFEPFYTTKPEGIGLGLFIVKQIVENSFGGSVSASSNRKDGTAFTIDLPKSHYPAPASRKKNR